MSEGGYFNPTQHLIVIFSIIVVFCELLRYTKGNDDDNDGNDMIDMNM